MENPAHAILNTPDVTVFVVGGFVRDTLLGHMPNDQDFVVVGGSTQLMLNAGFSPVGVDFPVFLHPVTNDEWALARTERKINKGHTGFETDSSADVTLHEDLGRRDLTFNAMAQQVLSFDDDRPILSEDIIDPFFGMADLHNGIIRKTTDAFAEDPLRVLRAARFAARFNFNIAQDTIGMMRQLVRSGTLEELSSERVWTEIAKAIQEQHPNRFFEILHQIKATDRLFPCLEVERRLRVRQLSSIESNNRIPLLMLDSTESSARETLTKLRAPVSTIDATIKCIRLNQWVLANGISCNKPKLIVELFNSLDTARSTSTITETCFPVQKVAFDVSSQRWLLEDCFDAALDISFKDLSTKEQQTLVGKQIGDRINDLRVEAVQRVLNTPNWIFR